MKRPQFSLRLIILIVAFAAVVSAWRRAVWEKENAPPAGGLKQIDLKLLGPIAPASANP